MELFWLLFAHFLADLSLQGNWVAKNKGKIALFMIGHCVIYTGVIALTLMALNLYSPWKIPFLFIGHYFMDSLKCKKYKNYKHIEQLLSNKEIKELDNYNLKWTYGDQLFHLLQLLMVYFL